MKYDNKFKAPYLMVEWHDKESSAKGYLAVYNFVSNFCSGGTRMHPTVTAEEVYRLARAMAYKYKACESTTTGGCKAGIVYDHKAPDAYEVLKRFNIAMAPLMKSGVNLGGDLGVDANDVFKIWDEIGIQVPQTQKMRKNPKVIEGTKNHDIMCDMSLGRFKVYDMITGFGVAMGADELWTLNGHKSGGNARVVIQGFGCLGASCAHKLMTMGYKVIGIVDVHGVVVNNDGLDIDLMLDTQVVKGEMNREELQSGCTLLPTSQWLDVECDILIPAALEDVLHKDNANNVKASVIVEGANICTTPEADKIFFGKGIDVGVDFVVNLGATRYYDSIIFNVVDKNPQEAMDDVEIIIRKGVKLVFDKSRKSNRIPRDVAEEIFTPDTFDTPDI